jgi:hypothetical protein
VRYFKNNFGVLAEEPAPKAGKIIAAIAKTNY